MPSRPPPHTSPVEAVILAAGLSTRAGHWKMALPLGDRNLANEPKC